MAVNREGKDMNATSVNPLNIRVQGTDRKFRCPRCGCVMEETERMAENGSLYIWYECSAPECDEQWLAKRPAYVG